jgi:hypothetical protein
VQFDSVNDKEFWKNVFSVLKENGTLQLTLSNLNKSDQIVSFMKMNGFTNASVNGGLISGSKVKWQAAGATLKRTAKQA